jgi:hypothetical protein
MGVKSVVRRGGTGLGLFGALLALYAWRAVAYSKIESPSVLFVCLLFIFPLIHFGVVSVLISRRSVLRSIYLWTIGTCFSCHLYLWSVYIWSVDAVTSNTLLFSSYAGLILAGLLTIECFVITGLTMHNGSKVAAQVKVYPFLSINFFMASFLHLTFFLTFSLAFHDRGPSRAIYVKDLGASGTSEKISPLNVRDFYGYIHFKEGSDEAEFNDLYLDQAVYDVATFKNPKDPEKSLIRRSFYNSQFFKDMLIAIDKLGDRTYFDILIVGHANDTELSRTGVARYGHNRFLAEDRAKWLENRIRGELKKINRLERASPKSSGGNQFLESKRPPVPYGLDPKLVVEVAIQPRQGNIESWLQDNLENRQKKLDLLDYIYFMTYTITTTGYGDMIPLTAQAKFTTVFANLLEVFFLVVFFNVILASIRPVERTVYLGFTGAKQKPGNSPNTSLSPSGQPPRK